MILGEKVHKECEACDLRSGCHQVVLPDAPTEGSFKLFVIGEAPGKDEDREGFGFVGSAGKKLDFVLQTAHEKVSISRSEFGRANIVCCRPPGNRAPKKPEVLACSSWLKETFTERFDVKVVLAVGGVPSSYFYKGKSLFEIIEQSERDGFRPDLPWARESGLLVVPMPHTSPLAFNRNAPSGEKWADIGMRQAAKAISLVI